MRLRTNRRPGIGLLFATLLERQRRLSSRNRVPDPFRGVCYGLSSLSSFLPPRSPGAWKTRASFFSPCANAIRKKAKSLSVGIAVARRRNTMDSMYHLNAYDARSSLGKNRGSKGRTRCSLLYSYRLLDSSFVHVIYDNRWGKGRQMRDNSLTWKCSMMVHIKPRVSFGFPSTISSARILTSLIFL